MSSTSVFDTMTIRDLCTRLAVNGVEIRSLTRINVANATALEAALTAIYACTMRRGDNEIRATGATSYDALKQGFAYAQQLGWFPK